MLPHRTERTKRIAAAVLKATNEWYAYAYFSYNEHKKEVFKFYREEVLEQEWKHHPPKKLGSVYGFVMRLLYEWSTRPLIETYIRGDGSGDFELPSGCEYRDLQADSDHACLSPSCGCALFYLISSPFLPSMWLNKYFSSCALSMAMQSPCRRQQRLRRH